MGRFARWTFTAAAFVFTSVGLFVMSGILFDLSAQMWSAKKHADEAGVRMKMNQIKAETVPIAMGIADLQSLSRDNAAYALRQAQEKGLPAITADLEFLRAHMKESDPDRPNIERLLAVLRQHNKVKTR
jgi:hypothetical protein